MGRFFSLETDGQISLEELGFMYPDSKEGRAKASERFASVDVDGSGELSRVEFVSSLTTGESGNRLHGTRKEFFDWIQKCRESHKKWTDKQMTKASNKTQKKKSRRRKKSGRK